jgi:hypothetical protein
VAAVLPAAAQASFPGTNGKIAFGRAVETPLETRCIYTANSDGTGEAVLLPPCDPEYRTKPRWSPDGIQIAYEGWAGQLDLVNQDGTNFREFFFDSGDGLTGHAWSPDGTEIAVSWQDCGGPSCSSEIGKVNSTTGAYTSIHTTSAYVAGLDWSPDGQRIAFARDFQVYTIKPDGTSLTEVAPGSPAENHSPSWSPDMSKLAFVTSRDEGIDEIYVMNPDGSAQTRITNNFAIDTSPRWSPDGTKIIFESDRDDGNHEIYVMNSNGTGQTRVTNNPGHDNSPDWRPIPVNTYVRPAGASPVRASLVPAFAACTAPNRQHGTPLAHPACDPPDLISDELTIGSPDVNTHANASTGFVRFNAVAGDPGTPADEADIRIRVRITDVFRQGTPPLADYDGELNLATSVRRTDRENSPHPGGNGAATVVFHIPYVTVPCAPTGTAAGATCNLTTTYDAIYPGIVVEGKRAIWALDKVQVQDGGADDDANTVGDNKLFMAQGVFVP